MEPTAAARPLTTGQTAQFTTLHDPQLTELLLLVSLAAGFLFLYQTQDATKTMEQLENLSFDTDKVLDVFNAIMEMLEEEDYRGTDFLLGVGAAIRAIVDDNFPSKDPDTLIKKALKVVELGTNISALGETDND